jgi:DNA-binding IclR family transcriptional regulator
MAHIPAERCLSIIQLLADEACEMPLGEIAERLKLPKSGAHRLLSTLVEQGWAVQNRHTGFYGLTMRLAILGQRYFAATGIPDLCQPLLDRLAADTREFVRMAVVDLTALVWVAEAQGATGGLMYQPRLASNTVPLYATASGKAWLSRLDDDEAREIIMSNGGFTAAAQYGPNVITTFEALAVELGLTRQRGYGIASSEAEPGVTAVAAAVLSPEDRSVIGTVSVAGPSVRMTAERVPALAEAVGTTARALSELWPLRRDSVGRAATKREAA